MNFSCLSTTEKKKNFHYIITYWPANRQSTKNILMNDNSFAFQISFGFDINYQLIDASLTTTESNSTTPTQDIINRGENIKENALTETGIVDKWIWIFKLF